MDPVKPTGRKLPFKRRRPHPKSLAENASPIVADSAAAKDPLMLFNRTNSVMPGVVASLDARAKKAEVKREREATEKRLREHSHHEDDAEPSSSGGHGTPKRKQSLLEPESPDKKPRRFSPDSVDNDTAIFLPEPTSVHQRSSSEQSTKPHTNAPASENIISLDSDSGSESDVKPSLPIYVPTTPSPATPSSSSKPMPIFDEPIDADLSIDTEADPVLLKYIESARKRYANSPAARPANAAAPATKVPSLIVTFSSRIAGTSPIPGFLLPIDRGLDEVRVAWLDQQAQKGTPIAHPLDLVFTWRGNEIYSTTTLRSLNIIRLSTSRLGVKGDESNPVGFSEDRRKVLLEVWTREVLERERERRLRASRLSAAADTADGDDNDISFAADIRHESRQDESLASPSTATQSATATPAAQTKLRLMLQTKDGVTAKLSATPDTQIATLAQAFAHGNAVPAGMRVQIWFDGLALQDDLALQDAEVEDRDTLEVHFVPL